MTRMKFYCAGHWHVCSIIHASPFIIFFYFICLNVLNAFETTLLKMTIWDHIHWIGLTVIQSRVYDNIPNTMWGKINYPFSYTNVCIVDVCNVIMGDGTYIMWAYGAPGCQRVGSLDSLRILSKTLIMWEIYWNTLYLYTDWFVQQILLTNKFKYQFTMCCVRHYLIIDFSVM